MENIELTNYHRKSQRTSFQFHTIRTKRFNEVHSMNISQLKYFVAAAQFEHFGAAAKSLYITQPALSNSISRLERELGVKLFDHIGRNVQITTTGGLFLKHVIRSLAELDEAVRIVSNNERATAKTVRIGAVAAVLRGYLSSLVSSSDAAIEGTIISDISQKGSTKECLAGLMDGSLDIAFCGYPVKSCGLEWTPLVPQNAVAALNAEHPLAHRDKITMAKIKDYPQLSYREPSYMFYAFEGLFKKYGLNPRAAFEDEISALSVVVTNKDSIGIMLDSVKDVIWGAIRMIPISELDAPYHYIGMAYKSGLPYSDEVRSLVEHIIKISNQLDYEEPLEREFYS